MRQNFPFIKLRRTEAISRTIKFKSLEIKNWTRKFFVIIMASNEEQTYPIPEDVEEAPAQEAQAQEAQAQEAQAQILETLFSWTLVREMKVNGFHLVERKQNTRSIRL